MGCYLILLFPVTSGVNQLKWLLAFGASFYVVTGDKLVDWGVRTQICLWNIRTVLFFNNRTIIGRVIMPLRTRNTTVDTVLREEYVGSSANRICYPGVSSCITITGVLPTGLVGVHITIASETPLIDEALLAMKTSGGSSCTRFYVVGAISRFKASTNNADVDKRKKIGNKIRSLVNKDASVRFFDTSFQQEAHIFVEHNGFAPTFSYAPAANNTVSGFTYPNIPNRTTINLNQFQPR
jgi:hypothetical protein